MAVQIESPTLGRGNDWNSFYGTEPFQGNDPFSPSAFGTLLFSQPDAASALDLLGGMPGGSLTFADIGGTIAIDQLPPGSLVTVDSIGEDGLYFFDDSSGLPSLINPDSTVSFISQHIGFLDLSGTISINQFPPGTVISVDSINEDAVYFFDNTLGLPKLINAVDLATFVGLNDITFADIGGTIGLSQFPPGSVAALDSIDEDALYFFDNTLFAPKLINAADALTFLGITGGSGSFLSANSARVDTSGNDSTGTVGDLGKPFLTVQPAIDALASVSGNANLFLGLGNFNGNVIVPASLYARLNVVGDDAESGATINGDVTLATASGSQNVLLTLLHCSVRAINADTTGTLTVIGQGAFIVDTVTNTSGPVTIESETQPSQINGVSAGGAISISGIDFSGTHSVSAPGFQISLSNCFTNYAVAGEYDGLITIDSAGSEVFATNSLIQEVTASGALHLKDARVVGTNNATSTVYADMLLLPRYQMSIDFDVTAGLKFINDSATPGNSKYYGTNSGGTKGYFALPSAGSGDVVGPSSSIDSEVALFNSTTGKLIKRATGSGLAVLTSGVLSTTTNNSSNWDTAFTERAQWNGGATNLVASTGRTSLGLVIGTNVQAWDADLDTLAGLTATTNNFIVSVGSAWASRTPTQVKTTLAIANTDVSGLGTLSTQSGTFSGTSSGTNTGDQTITLTGDVTGSGTGSFAATLGNIPTAVTMAGYLAATAIAAPGTPGAGIGRIYLDSTSKNLAIKDDAGVIKHGVQTKASATSNFLTAISDAGVVSAAQPADSDISFTDITTGNATTSQHGFMPKFPGGTVNFLRADGTFTTPGGGGTVTSIATTSPISGGTITATGTLSLLVNVDHAFTASQSITTAPAANTVGTGLLLTDTTAASSGNQQYSPALIFTGQGWKTTATAASQEVDFRIYAVPVQGSANPSGNLVIESNINLAGYTANQFTFKSGGKFLIGVQQLYANGNNLVYSSSGSSNNEVQFSGGGGVALANGKGYNWTSSATDAGGTADTALFRNAAGVVEINNGTAASYRDLKLRNIVATGTATTYNNIATAGMGLPYIVGVGRVTAQSAANSNIVTYTTPASDGSYEISMNMNVTAVTALSTSMNCDYTDESNTARTMIFPTTSLSGAFLAGGLVTSTGAFETPVMHIRTKASTTIKLYTAAGTFTSVTYTAEGIIKQMA